MKQPAIHKIIRSRRGTVGLEVTSDARLIVRAPWVMSREMIDEWVGRKLPWIERRQAFARKNYLPSTPKIFAAGEKFAYLGEEYELFTVPGAYGPLAFDGKGFFLREGCASLAKWLFRDWYRERAAEYLEARVRHTTGITGARFTRIKISDARTRWGSCSARGVLSFSWRLMMAPREVVDYVAVHEVVHLGEFNHSRKFWQKVKSLMPDYLRARQWLEAHHRPLQNDI